jgi:pantoate--beta-alanine ligase
MTLLNQVGAMRRLADGWRSGGQRHALVPTMGALHEGHLALVRQAKERADRVTVSIFVNPTQFGPGEDFDTYPRTLEADLALLEQVGGVDAVFAPSVAEMYPAGAGEARTFVEVEELTEGLCGAYRPGHFRGVTTVVAKLLIACRPDLAVFGLKDVQQFVVLRRMAEELLLGVELVGVETQRESDGLAMSSRNRNLTPEQRAQAPVLAEALGVAKEAILTGELQSDRVVARMMQHLRVVPDARVQYAALVDPETLRPVETIQRGTTVLIALAAYLGETRLIDNTFVEVPLVPQV